MARPKFLLIPAIFLLLIRVLPGQAQPVNAELTISRITDERFQLSFWFSQPVSQLSFGPGVPGYHQQAWRLGSGEPLVLDTDGTIQLATGRTELVIEVDFYPAYLPAHYVPMARFSDGGMALYTGYFLPDLIIDQVQVSPATTVRLAGRQGETSLISPAGARGEPGFAYFGPQSQSTDWGFAVVVLDPGLPDWIATTFRQVLEQVSAVYLLEMPSETPDKPIILAAAGDLESIEGYSIKGGALADQILFTLRGPVLKTETDEFRASLQKLMAHELAHLWQRGLTSKRIPTEDPWIHEGAAEAMALAGLTQSGLWSQEKGEAFAQDMAQACRTATEHSALPQVVAQGNYDAVYSCGFGLFWQAHIGVFELWPPIESAASMSDHGYSQDLFDQVVESLKQP